MEIPLKTSVCETIRIAVDLGDSFRMVVSRSLYGRIRPQLRAESPVKHTDPETMLARNISKNKWWYRDFCTTTQIWL